jgi:AraC-like DNA-binding protein
VDYIDANRRNIELNAEKIALHVRLSVSHLNRLFHREFGMPIMRFVWQRRLEWGRKLLLNSSYNVMQIGYQCGYAHISSFIEAFIRAYGLSPTEFRKRHSTDD